MGSLSQQSNHPGYLNRKGFELKDQDIKMKIKELSKASLQKTLIAIGFDWTVIGVCCFISNWFYIKTNNDFSILSIIVFMFACFVIATRQRALENLIHEATHYNLSSNLKLNDLLAWTFAALPLGHNLKTERKLHVQGHHKNFWDIKQDPDYQRYQEAGFDKFPVESYFELFKILFKAFPAYLHGTVIAFILPKNESKVHFFLRIFVYWFFITYLFYIFDGLNLLVMYWFLPQMTFLVLIRYIGEVTEHAALECKDEFQSTRNNLGWLNEYVIHPNGDAYHLIHHLFPKIPFYNMRKAHNVLMLDKTYSKSGIHCTSFFGSKRTATFKQLIK